MNNKLIQDIILMSTPGKIILLFILLIIIYILFKKNNINNKIKNILKIIFVGFIYIFILNWLCNNNMCWASWIMVITKLIFICITLLLSLSIFNFTSSLKYRINKNIYNI
jgi:hypothetical protein